MALSNYIPDELIVLYILDLEFEILDLIEKLTFKCQILNDHKWLRIAYNSVCKILTEFKMVQFLIISYKLAVVLLQHNNMIL